MKYEIKNDYLTAIIDSKGAQLIELIDENGVNRMHDTNHDSWKKVSPILFPQISRMKNLSYKVKGKSYHMPAHGFLRDNELIVNKQGKDFIEFKFISNDDTYLMYPYHFEFYVRYSLNYKRLAVEFKVVNLDDSDMLFMLGGHPGFNLFTNSKINYNDYYIKFEKKETIDAMQVVDGYLANVYKRVLTDQDYINLSHEIFNPDAIVMRNLKSKYLDILCKKSDFDIRFYYPDFEILAIWSTTIQDDNFVCLEPWNGIQKEFVEDHEKMGVLSLKGHDTYKVSYTIEIVK